ncbi:type II toxin-antitoxin system PemK/MazF family toxin [Gloeocapsopsis sp. IPPAS B-1203]|uniref:type II toxin-antitoxin system PemK/MazF family toxin n=1 Tax=Gloeocapsopsis sp. IPPAS B-1203 TaxID=2049454 RepID=UPI000C176753|nr:type II toxin-antitoxin system PemK/MazF family toxin [Gloeocapsopsis sp. IPPAS B-1203]PIG93025.1 growth inhibitor [Gloeocapsopsis sp. IPPAS B-1203]
MQSYESRDIILLSFPFANATELKRRPALVLLDTGDEDIIVARITSQITQGMFDVELLDWQQSGLRLASVVRVNKIATLEKRLVERRLGILTLEDWRRVQSKVSQLWNAML